MNAGDATALTAPTMFLVPSISAELLADAEAIQAAQRAAYARGLHERDFGKPYTGTGARMAWRYGYAAGFAGDPPATSATYDRAVHRQPRWGRLAREAWHAGVAAGLADHERHAGRTVWQLMAAAVAA